MLYEKRLAGQSKWIAFLDETGDPTLSSVDPDYPIFGVATIICRREMYLDEICQHAMCIKHAYFGHEGIILHSYSIRKRRSEFAVLHDEVTRKAFMDDIANFARDNEYCIFFAAIDKLRYTGKYGQQALNSYHQVLGFILERLYYFCRDNGIRRLPLIAEMRGKKEDDALRLHFFQVLAQGTKYISASQFAQCGFDLEFASKKRNITGLQLADLCAYPLARHLASGYAGPDYSIVSKKLYSMNGVCYGMKVFPPKK